MNSPFDYSNTPLTEIYGSLCFNDTVMKRLLQSEVYEELLQVQKGAIDLTPQTAEAVAQAMKEWAIAKGETHFTHWFQPLTCMTEEKHD